MEDAKILPGSDDEGANGNNGMLTYRIVFGVWEEREPLRWPALRSAARRLEAGMPSDSKTVYYIERLLNGDSGIQMVNLPSGGSLVLLPTR